MKRMLITALLAFVGTMGFAQYYTYDNCAVLFLNYPNTEGVLVYENDSVRFEFEVKYGAFNVDIENKCDQPIAVDWEEGSFVHGSQSGRILFGDDSRLMKDREKLPSKVMPGSRIDKTIMSDAAVHTDYADPLYRLKSMKKNGQRYYHTIYLPIDYGDRKQTYKFEFRIEYSGKKS